MKNKYMKKLLGIVVLCLLCSGVALAGSLVNTKWEFTPIPIENTNKPYTIIFLHNDECIYKGTSKGVITCVWKSFGNELYYTINNHSFTEVIVSRKSARGKGHNNSGDEWKVIGKRID
tara:strand:- start:9 stop:362 length:354 start_codon:yes stop_codon:yes gene_type:complete